MNNVCSDVITLMAADGSFDRVPLRAIAANGSSIIVALPAIAGGIDIDDGGGDDIRVGDLIMLTNGISTLLYVSAVNGAEQTITFAVGDPFRLNQFDPIDVNPPDRRDGRDDQPGRSSAPPSRPRPHNANGTPRVTATRASRIRMLTYYVRIDPAGSRQPASAADDQQCNFGPIQPERQHRRFRGRAVPPHLRPRRRRSTTGSTSP